MAEWIDPIYDRTLDDVNRVSYLRDSYLNGTITADEILEYSQDLKGAINRSDLERISNNMAVLGDIIGQPVSMPEFTIPRVSWYEQLLRNINFLRSFFARANLPDTPSQPLNDYEKWNAIERILYECYHIMDIRIYYMMGDEIYTGDTVGFLL